MAEDATTIEIKMDTWQELNQRKSRPGESFDDVIKELLLLAEADDAHSDESPTEPRELQPHEQEQLEVEADDPVDKLYRTMTDALRDFDVGLQSGTRDERVEAVVQAALLLRRENRELRKADFVDTLYPEHQFTDESAENWWTETIRKGLTMLIENTDCVEKSGRYGYVWTEPGQSSE